jgi:hypothetical protein
MEGAESRCTCAALMRTLGRDPPFCEHWLSLEDCVGGKALRVSPTLDCTCLQHLPTEPLDCDMARTRLDPSPDHWTGLSGAS